MPTPHHKSDFILKPLSHAVLLACISLGAAALTAPINPAQAQTAAAAALQRFDIPAGSLESALQQFARQSGVSLAYGPDRVQGLRSSGVQGNHSVGSALQQLLAGTGLTASQQANGGYRLEQLAASAKQQGSEALALPSLDVHGFYVSQDEQGANEVYSKDISNLYVDRKYLERYRGTSVGDVFAGMNGVFNSDNRNGAALTPNIRGLQGNGRIPVTVDGTVQTTDVWMAMQGITNRSYVDPNMFRSIHVEKGPSMTRGVKSGIGGSVQIRTIEADDLIRGDKNWGLEIKGGTASNSVKSNMVNPFNYEGMDYRDIPGAIGAGPWGVVGVAFHEPQATLRKRGEVDFFNLDNNSLFLAGAFRHERFDVLGAYSYSERGNYFSGKKNADKFKGRGASSSTGNHYQSLDSLYPTAAVIYQSGWEVPYTSEEMESLLLKANWYLSDEQKLSLNYTRNDFEFAETPNAMTSQSLWDSEVNSFLTNARQRLVYPFPNTTVEQDVYRLGYEWKPQDSNLIDLEMALWHTDSDSSRYQNGDFTYQIASQDVPWDQWTGWKYGCANGTHANPAQCDQQREQPERQPNTDGRYNVAIGNEQLGSSKRTGFDISNRFQLSDSLALTAAADYQYERQRETVADLEPIVEFGYANQRFGPASGHRREYGISMNLDWAATSRLQLSGGVRYGAFSGFDSELDRRRRDQDPKWRLTGVTTHQVVTSYRLVTAEEQAAQDHVRALALITNQANIAWRNAGRPTSGPVYDDLMSKAAASSAAQYAFNAYKAENGIVGNQSEHASERGSGVQRWTVNHEIPLVDGKADRNQNPFYNGSIDPDKMVENPQGVDGSYPEYLVADAYDIWNGYIVDRTGDEWRRPKKNRADAWSGLLVASYQLTDRSRAYVRYGSMARFPSIHEGASEMRGIYASNNKLDKPERNETWEVGYTYNFSGLLPSLRLADAKISYFDSTIHDFYDRTILLQGIQFDRKIMRGIEMQGRADTGRFYGNLGVTYLLQQDMCDKDYAIQLSPARQRIPECMPGGFTNTLSFVSLQPEYSVTLDLGTRLFNQKLDLGTRLRYHARAENDKMDDLLKAGVSEAYTGMIRPYYWDPVKLVDLYAEYQFNDQLNMRMTVENVTDLYYLDPLSKSPTPGPGRTVMLDVGLRF